MASANVSNMYDRVGNHGAHLDKRTPRSYSALVLPSKQELRNRGLTDSAAMWGWNRDHPYAKWETHSFDRGTTTQDALGIVEAFNMGNDRVVKIRITFSDGTHINLSRKTPAKPDTLKAVGTYDPNEAFRAKTEGLATISRNDQLKRTMPIVNERGHLSNRRPDSASTFAPERLFGDCPINDPSQTGFAFTPVGYNSFMVRPNYRIPGCKPTIASFSESAFAYRPRGYGNSEFPNYEEITGRNEVSKPRSERAEENIYTGSFLRQTMGKGAPLSPSFLRNTATGTLNNSYHNSTEARRNAARAQSASAARAAASFGRRGGEQQQQMPALNGGGSLRQRPSSAASRGSSVSNGGYGAAQPTVRGYGHGFGGGAASNEVSPARSALKKQQQRAAVDAEEGHYGYGDEEGGGENVYNMGGRPPKGSNGSPNSPSRVVLGPGGRVRVHYKDTPPASEVSGDGFDAPPTPVLAD